MPPTANLEQHAAWLNRTRLRRLGIPCLAAFFALNAVLLWQFRDSIFAGYGDFASFYAAGKLVAGGHSSELYNPAYQQGAQRDFAAEVKIRNGPLPYIRPPFEALLFLPFAYLSYHAAWISWTLLKLVLILAIPFVLHAHSGERGLSVCLLESLLCLATFPVGLDFLQGQDAVLLFFVFALALRFILQGRNALGGAVLALGLFKFNLVLPFLFVFAVTFPKRSRLLSGFFATAMALALISWAMVGWSGVAHYPAYVWHLHERPEWGVVQARSMPNLRGLLALLVGSGNMSRFIYIAFAAGAMLLGLLAIWSRRTSTANAEPRSRESVARFSFAITISLFVSYYSNSYDLTLLLLPLLMLGRSFVEAPAAWPRGLFLATASILLCTPLFWSLFLRSNQISWAALLLPALALAIYVQRREERIFS